MCYEPVRCAYCGVRVAPDTEEYCEECGPFLKAVKAALRSEEH